MDGVAQANYALSYLANVGVQQQQWPAKEQQQVNNVVSAPEKGVGAVDAQYPEIGIDGRPVEPGTKFMRSVDGDTVTISPEGQAFVQQAAAAADTPDMTSATARVEEGDGARVDPAEAAQMERPAETRYDLPQGGGIERAEFEQPEVQRIQTDAEETQAEERTALQLQPREEEPSALEAAPEEEEASEEIEPSEFRQYFNSELRQMLYRGQITQQQYDDEMESRKNEDDLKIDKKVV